MMTIRTLRALACALPLLAACAPAGGAAPAPAIETMEFAPSLSVDLAAMTRTPSGLYWRDTKPGTGTEARNGRRVSMRYVGWLPDGTMVDFARDTPLEFRLGSRDVIDGWNQGIAGMRAGGQRLLVIPPALAYGRRGNGPVPPNAVLVFLVELVEVG